jgi:hypothetical protein
MRKKLQDIDDDSADEVESKDKIMDLNGYPSLLLEDKGTKMLRQSVPLKSINKKMLTSQEDSKKNRKNMGSIAKSNNLKSSQVSDPSAMLMYSIKDDETLHQGKFEDSLFDDIVDRNRNAKSLHNRQSCTDGDETAVFEKKHSHRHT